VTLARPSAATISGPGGGTAPRTGAGQLLCGARLGDPRDLFWGRILLALTPTAAGLVPALVELADQKDEAFYGTLPRAQRAELDHGSEIAS